MSSIAIGVVVYNPKDKGRFIESLQSLIVQNRKIYLFDNSTIDSCLNIPESITYLTEHRNCGIAYALNKIMENAEHDGFDWVITMDQDSIIPQNALNYYEKYINRNRIGIICPQVIDKRRAYMKVKEFPKEEYVKYCITSASCTSIKAWKEIGGFDEWLFIDLVDNEFCKRLTLSNYKILKLNNLVLNQEFGKIERKSEKVVKFWLKISEIMHNINFAKFSYKKQVDPMRVYYTNRNIIYINKKLKKYGNTGFESYNCKSYFGFQFCFNVPSILRASDKKAVLRSIIRGISEGKKKTVEEWSVNND